MIFFKNLFVYSGAIVETVNPCCRGKFNKIMVSLPVFGKNNKVLAGTVNLLCFIKTSSSGHISLASNNPLETLFFALIIECFNPKHVSMVSQSHSWHIISFGFSYHIFYSCCTIKN